MKNYYDFIKVEYASGIWLYCVDDPNDELYVLGNTDGFYSRQKEHSNLDLEIDTCNIPKGNPIPYNNQTSVEDVRSVHYQCSSDKEI